MATDTRPLHIRRAEINRSTPFPEEKREIWANVSIPQTGIRRETGGYKPFRITEQAHDHPAGTIMVTGGIRGSKSQSLSMEALTWLLHSDLIWLVGQSYDDCRQEFEYVAEAALSLGWTNNRLISFPQNKYAPCVLETNWGTLLETKSAADPGSLMSRAPDFIGLCEPGKMDIASYRRSQERLSTWRGALWLNGTFETTAPWMEEFWTAWKRWPNEWNAKSFSSPTYTNPIIYPGGLQDPGIQLLRLTAEDFDEYLRRVVGVPASLPEIIFSSTFKAKQHVGRVEYKQKNDKGDYNPVYLAIDPGYSGNSRYVVLAIQIEGKRIRVIDEVVGRQKTHQEMKRECSPREWWPFARTGTIDPHAGESHVFGAVSPAEEWRRKDDPTGPVDLSSPQRLHVEELIRLIQSYLNGSSGWTLEIDQRCERLRFEFGSWKRKRNQMGLGAPNEAPSDAAKALGYFLTHHANGMIRSTQRQEIITMPYSLTGAGVDPVFMGIAAMDDAYEERRVWGDPSEMWI